MIVNDIMTREVATINSDDSALDACKRYNRLNIGCLVVMKDHSIVGIVTERDMISRIIIPQRNAFTTKVEEIMSSNIVSIEPSTDLEEAVEIMIKHNIKKLPVISEDGSLAGIVTITDILKEMPHLLAELV